MPAALQTASRWGTARLAAGWDRVVALPAPLLLGVLFAAFLGLSVWEMHDESVTTDELVHLSSGWTYLAAGDFRLNTEHPLLTKAVSSLPLQLLNLRWPTSDDWDFGRQWQFGFRFLFMSGNDADRILFWSRLFMLPWGLLLIGSVYGITRSLFGPSGALLSAVLATLLPMFLGHAHLVTTDVPVAAMMLLTAWGFERLAGRPTLATSLICGALFGVALTVKFSAVLLLPPMFWFLATRWIPPLWRLRKAGRATLLRSVARHVA
jgi:Dolichyl-phosphate-mannose-protein mannosyltransferase